MQGVLKDIYDYKVDLVNNLKTKETQKSLENKISTADLNKNNPSTTSEVGDYISKKIKEENL